MPNWPGKNKTSITPYELGIPTTDISGVIDECFKLVRISHGLDNNSLFGFTINYNSDRTEILDISSCGVDLTIHNDISNNVNYSYIENSDLFIDIRANNFDSSSDTIFNNTLDSDNSNNQKLEPQIRYSYSLLLDKITIQENNIEYDSSKLKYYTKSEFNSNLNSSSTQIYLSLIHI